MTEKLDRIRNETLDRMRRNEMWFRVLLVSAGVAEAAGLISLVMLMDWSDRTHLVIFVASLLVYLTLGFWTWALAARSRIGEQRILRAVELVAERLAQDRESEEADDSL